MPSIQKVIRSIVLVIVIGAVLWLLDFMVGRIPLQPPYSTVAHAIILVCGVLLLIGVLLDLVGITIFKSGGPSE